MLPFSINDNFFSKNDFFVLYYIENIIIISNIFITEHRFPSKNFMENKRCKCYYKFYLKLNSYFDKNMFIEWISTYICYQRLSIN